MKSIYTFKNDDFKISISFEIDNKEKDNNIRDKIAEDYLNRLVNTICDFYLDDVIEIKEGGLK